MKRILLSLFVGTVNEQSRFGIIAAQNLDRALNALRAPEVSHELQEQTSEALWLWLHTLLNSAANVSKTLFPADHRRLPDRRKTIDVEPSLARRGELVRLFLQTADESPLRVEERKLRNHLEHLDERLEEWWITDPSHNIARRTIGPFDSIVGLDAGSLFEQYDPAKQAVAFRGDVIELPPLVGELNRLLLLTDPLMRTHWNSWVLPNDWPGSV